MRLTVVVAVIDPPDAINWTGYVPANAAAEAVTTSVLEPAPGAAKLEGK
jgi:hypothetical protein